MEALLADGRRRGAQDAHVVDVADGLVRAHDKEDGPPARTGSAALSGGWVGGANRDSLVGVSGEERVCACVDESLDVRSGGCVHLQLLACQAEGVSTGETDHTSSIQNILFVNGLRRICRLHENFVLLGSSGKSLRICPVDSNSSNISPHGLH